METAGDILTNPDPKKSTPMPESWRENLRRRKALVEIQIRRMFLSAGQEIPGPEALALRVDDALMLWWDIPDEELPAVIGEAIVQSDGHVPGSGRVSKIHRHGEHRRKNIQAEETGKFLQRLEKAKLEAADPEYVSQICRATIRKLEGGTT